MYLVLEIKNENIKIKSKNMMRKLYFSNISSTKIKIKVIIEKNILSPKIKIKSKNMIYHIVKLR